MSLLAYDQLQELEPSYETRVLQEYPYIALGGTGLYDLKLGTISNIEFGEEKIHVQKPDSTYTDSEFAVAVLATLGLEAKEIAAVTYNGAATVRTQTNSVLAKTHDEITWPKFTSAGLARYFFTEGIYAFDHDSPAHPLDMRPAEARAIEQVSFGKTDPIAGEDMGLGRQTISTQLKAAAVRNHFNGRNQLVLASILSGQTSVYLDRTDLRSRRLSLVSSAEDIAAR
jgi:DNA-binding CsgD family transcriptional regulator